MTGARRLIEAIYGAAIDEVDPEKCVIEALRPSEDGSTLTIGGVAVSIPESGVYLIGLGKASPAMARGAVVALGDSLIRGIVVAKEARNTGPVKVDVLQGSHPVPDERSLAAGEEIVAFAREVPAGALVLCVISGGGSALAEALRPGVSLEMMREVTSRLLDGGASIHELNAVRSRLSALKGGGLLMELAHTSVVNLIISDVLGDDLSVIASGPTVQPLPGLRADDVLASYRLDDVELPALPTAVAPTAPLTQVIANVETAVHAAARSAVEAGLRPVVLTKCLEGEAREVGRIIAAVAAGAGDEHSPLRANYCLLAGGETTVTVRGDGVGGRNTEAALAAALALEGDRQATLGFLATDGDDGVSNAAGAIIDGATINADNRGTATNALERNDSFGFLAGIGAAWSPGATGTNVNDLVIGVIEAK